MPGRNVRGRRAAEGYPGCTTGVREPERNQVLDDVVAWLLSGCRPSRPVAALHRLAHDQRQDAGPHRSLHDRRHRQPHGPTFSRHRTAVGHGGVIDLAVAPVAQTAVLRRPSTRRTITIGAAGTRADCGPMCSSSCHRGGQRRADVASIRRSCTLRVRRGHRHQPRPMRQWSRWSRHPTLPRLRERTGPRRRSPPMASSWRSAPGSASDAEQARQEARTVIVRLVPGAPAGQDIPSCMSTTVVPLRRAAPGEPAGPPRDTRRRLQRR